MNKPLDLDAKNRVTVMLVQALWGTISPNFRLVAIELTGAIWQMIFILEKEDIRDREEIEDIVGEFDGLLLSLNNEGTHKFTATVSVNNKELPILDHSSWRLVYRRKED